MSAKPVSVAKFGQHTYVVGVDSTQTAQYLACCNQEAEFEDVDISASLPVTNTNGVRRCVLVQNGSGTTISAGMALMWVSGYWGTKVQACTAGSAIRCFAPSYVNGSTANTIPDGAFFYAVVSGFTSPLSDGSVIAINDGLVVGLTTGEVRTDLGLGGGEVYSSVAASTVLTNTTVATKYDQSYSFPAKTLNAGDHILAKAQVSIPSANSTNTLLTELMLGTQVVGTLAAFDPTDGGGDIIEIIADIEIRTTGASGTMVANVLFVKSLNGTGSVKEVQLASTTIDTTAIQQLAVRGTWSVADPANQSRIDMLNVARLNGTAPSVKSGGTAIAAAGAGSAVQFRAHVNCTW